MRAIYFVLLIAILGCNNEQSKPRQFGLLEKVLSDSTYLPIIKTTSSRVIYAENPTDRGYYFTPNKDIKLTSLGGRIAAQGKYVITLLFTEAIFKMDTLIQEEINITNTDVFQYAALKEPITLRAGKKYIISYFNENHNSVYDAGAGRFLDYSKSCNFPMVLNDITINTLFYSYYALAPDNKKYLTVYGSFNEGIFRGLVDFKYEVVK
ncbi:MAG TPA: hypothetical protein VD908_12120 [Cytophagales bacterium]|nr:hypothetical protein [Cytophagales bacterium]